MTIDTFLYPQNHFSCLESNHFRVGSSSVRFRSNLGSICLMHSLVHFSFSLGSVCFIKHTTWCMHIYMTATYTSTHPQAYICTIDILKTNSSSLLIAPFQKLPRISQSFNPNNSFSSFSSQCAPKSINIHSSISSLTYL